ncbi:MAG: hypothetical protein P8L74_00155 [Gammaproteobacteria bacterium]|nr:hypothetical protein [Gammaproteobacteria bacterium]
MIINEQNDHSNRKIIREKFLADNIVIVDGFPGCGKTLFGPIISSYDRVEIMQYMFEIEFICRLSHLGKISTDATISMIRMLSDQKLYQCMMGRDTNFRYRDLSSVFKYHSPSKYLKRIFQAGDMVVPDRINSSEPILSFVSHDLFSYSEPVFEALNDRLTFIEIVRHPLYMIIQQTLNMERLFTGSEARDIQIYFEYQNNEMPYFCQGWEDQYISSNNIDRAIYSIYHANKLSAKMRSKVKTDYKKTRYLKVPFEKFVIDPYPYLDLFSLNLSSKINKDTTKALKEQNVPRKKIADGIPLEVYQRCGWEPSDENLSEEEELEKRRSWAVEMGATEQALEVLDMMSKEYTEQNLR